MSDRAGVLILGSGGGKGKGGGEYTLSLLTAFVLHGTSMANLTRFGLPTSLKRANLHLEIQVDLLAVLTLSFSFSLLTVGRPQLHQKVQHNSIQGKPQIISSWGSGGFGGRHFLESGMSGRRGNEE